MTMKATKPGPGGRWAVRATNHATGEIWSIHDSRKSCEAELERKLADWGKPGDETGITIEWADLSDDVAAEDDEPAPVIVPPVVAEGDGVSDTVE